MNQKISIKWVDYAQRLNLELQGWHWTGKTRGKEENSEYAMTPTASSTHKYTRKTYRRR